MMASPKTLVLANLEAGDGRAQRVLPRVRAFFEDQGLVAHYATPSSAEEVRRSAKEAAAAGYQRIVVMGGDGTVQQVAAGVLNSQMVLGIIPAGSGNDVAEALGIPRDPIDAARALLHAAPRPMDVLRARCAEGRGGIYVGGGGLGIDAESLKFSNGIFRRLPGPARYVAGALRALFRFQPVTVEAELDGKRVDSSERVMLVTVSNTPGYGAGLKIASGAEIDDGCLDLVLVKELSWARLLELIPVLLETGAVRGPEVRRFRGRRVVLRTDRPAKFHGDGEILGDTPVEIEVLPSAIRVAAPRRA